MIVTLINIFKAFTEALDTILIKTRALALPTLPGNAQSLPSLPTEKGYVLHYINRKDRMLINIPLDRYEKVYKLM